MSPRDTQLDAIQEILLGEIRGLRIEIKEMAKELAEIKFEMAGMKLRAGMAGSALGFLAGFLPNMADRIFHFK